LSFSILLLLLCLLLQNAPFRRQCVLEIIIQARLNSLCFVQNGKFRWAAVLKWGRSVAFYWVLTPCSFVGGYRRFGRTCCLHIPATRLHGVVWQVTTNTLTDLRSRQQASLITYRRSKEARH
jgi:hypothetical protein